MTAKAWFALGMLAGAAVGAALVYRKAREDAMKAASEEIEAYKTALEGRRVTKRVEPQNGSETPLNPLQTGFVKPAASALVREFASRRPDLSSDVEHNITESQQAMDIVQEVQEKGGEEPLLNALPRVISEQEWTNGAGFSDVELLYYEGDGVVVLVDDDEIIDDPIMLLGDALAHFGESSSDPDYVIVRNFKYMVDYGITRLHSSYADLY